MASKKKKAVNKISEEERRAIKSSARPGLTAEGTLNAAAKEQARNRNKASEVLQELARKRQAEEQERQARIERTGIVNGRQTGLMTKLGYEDRQKQLQKKIYFDLRGDQLTNPQQTLPGQKFEAATGKEFPGKKKSETSASLPTETKKSWPYVSNEQVQQNWNKYLSEKYAPKQTDKWKGISQDLQNGYEGVFNPQSGKNFELYDAKGNTIPFNAYALKQAGVDVNKVNDLANDLYGQYVFNRNRTKQPEELQYGGWMQGQSEDTKKALQLSTNKGRVDKDVADISAGRYNGTGDYWRYNTQGLNTAYAGFQNQYDEAEKEIKRLNELTEQGYAQQADRLAWMPTVAADSTKGLYDDLAEMGYGSYLLMDRDAAGQNVTNMYAGGKITTGDQEAVRMEVFNQLYSNGMQNSYYEITSGMNEEQKAWLDNRLDEIIEGMVNPYEMETTDYSSQIANAESKMRYAKGQMDLIDSQLKWNSKYDELISKTEAAGLTDIAYHPELDTGMENVQHIKWRSAEDNVMDNADDIYSFINGGKSYQAWLYREGDEIPEEYFGYASMMSSKEIALFNAYYNAGRKGDAFAFYQGLMTTLTQRYMFPEEVRRRDEAKRHPILSSMRTFVDTMAQPGEFIAQMAGRLLGDEQAGNPYGYYFSPTRDKIYTRDYVGTELEEAGVPNGKFWYNNVMSAGDSFLNAYTAGGGAGAAAGLSKTALTAGTLSLFFTDAFQTSLHTNLVESHGNQELSVACATIDALIETTTEILSVEALLGDPKNLIKYIAKTSFSEASEEFTGSAFGPLIKEMILHKNEWKERADQILALGGYNKDGEWIPVDNIEDATRQALREWNHDIFVSTASGFFSTGGSVFYGTTQNLARNIQLGRAINSNNVNGEYQATEAMAEAAQKMGVGTESYKAADSVLKRIREGKKPGNFRTGKMVSSTITEANEQINTTVEEVTDRRVMEDLKKQGLEGKALTDAQDLVMKAIKAGGVENLSKSLQKKLQSNEKAKSVYEMYAEKTEESKAAAQEIMEKTTEARGANSVAMALLENQKTKKNVYTGRNVATEDDVRQATGEEVKGPKGIIYNGQHAELGDLKLVTVKDENGVEVKDKNGKVKTELRYEVRIPGIDKTFEAEPTEILTTNHGVAAVIEAQTNLPDFYSRAYVNGMLMEMNNRQVQNNPAGFMQDAMLIRFAAFQQQGMPKTELPQDVAERLYKLAAAEKTANRAKETSAEERNARGKGQGIVRFNGTVSGTQEFENELSKLSDTDQEYLRMITDLATEAGMELTFTDAADLGGIDVYGSEHKTGIRINMEGRNFEKNSETGKYVPTEKHDYIVTFGHETVHFLQRNSLEGYNNLEKFVLDEQRKKLGTAGLNNRILDIMDKQNLDLDHAISEMVADSMDQIFGNEDVVNHIRQENPGLFKQLKNAVHEILQKIRNLMKNSMSEDARRMLNVSAKRIADVFNEAWDEAVSGVISEDTQKNQDNEQETEEKYSRFEKEYQFANDFISNINLFMSNRDAFKQKLNDDQLLIGMTPKILTELGIKNRPFVINQKHIESILGENADPAHKMTPDQFIRIIRKANNPAAIIYSRSQYHHNDSVVVIVDEIINKRPVVIPIHVSVEGEYNGITIDVNKLATAFGRNEFKNVMQDAINVEEEGKEPGVYYVSENKKKANFLGNQGVQFPNAAKYKGLMHKITDNPNFVKQSDLHPKSTKNVEKGIKRYSRAQLDQEYDQAIKDGDVKRQQELVDEAAKRAFPNSKLIQENGEFFKMWHHTNSEFTEFLPGIKEGPGRVKGIYFTPNEYGSVSSKNASVHKQYYLNVEKQVFAFGVKEDAKYVEELRKRQEGVTDRQEIARINKQFSEETGIDALFDWQNQWYTILNPENIKSADPVTYDNDGNVIPLSERFNSENKDIRWSRAQMDLEYDKAVKDGDEKKQLELVGQAAKQNGYSLKVYHGTPTGGFTIFRNWSYFTENKEYADRYNHHSASSIRGYAVDDSNPMTYELYMKKGRVFDTRKAAAAKIYNQYRMEYGLGQLTDNGLPDWTDGRDIIDFIEENDLPYDTILLNEGADGGYGEEVKPRGISYVTRNNLVKSADPVTYDDKGKVIPLSERFDSSRDDIRWSRHVQETRDLIAVHNLTEQNLLDTLKEGGFTAPSIAIIKAAMGHSKFGEISVIFRKDTIDPRRNAKNKVYGMDAWTPTRSNAQIETKLDYNKLLEAQKQVEDQMKNVEPALAREASRWINEKAYHETTTKTIDDWALEVMGNEGMLAAYLTDKGEEIPVQMREVKDNSDLKEENEALYNEFLQELERLGMLDKFMQQMKEQNADFNIEAWAKMFGQYGDETNHKLAENALEKGGISKKVLWNRLMQVYLYEQAGRQIKTHPEFDNYATRQAMQNMVKREDVTRWLRGLVGDAFGEKGVYNGVDPYTDMGNRRSFKATHWAPTAENIVKAMYRNHDAKGGEAGRATGLMAKASKEYRNISEIKADADRLKMLGEEEYSQMVEDLDNRLDEFLDELSENSELGKYSVRSIMIDASETYAKTGSIAAFAAKMKREGVQMTAEQEETAQQLMEEARNIPTGYFEAKPERVVGTDEIDTVMVTPDTSDELLNELDKNNINYIQYDGTDEDRQRVLNSLDDARFSRWTEQSMDVNAWLAGATASTFQTEDERVMWQAWKDLRMKIQLSLKRQLMYQEQIRKIESKTEQTAEDRSQLAALYNKLDIQKNKMDRLEDELQHVVSDEGYAGMMYRNNVVLGDYIAGKTQDQVRQTVEQMVKEVQKAKEEIEKQTAELKKLAETQAVKTMQSFFGKTSLKKMAGMLRKFYGSTMSKTEVESRLAEMALKQARGESITDDCMALAVDLVDKIRGIRSESLENLRGTTFVIGESLAKELKAENLSLQEIRSRIKGSGVRFVTGTKSQTGTVDKHSRISEQWEELRAKDGALPDVSDMSEIEKLHTIVDFIANTMEKSTGAQQLGIDMDEAALFVRSAVGNVTTYLVDNPQARGQIENLMKQIRDLSNKTGEIAGSMNELSKKMEDVENAGIKARGWTTVLQRDVNDAINYYNKMAGVAARQEKQKVKEMLIDQLKSENTKKLVEQRIKYEDMIKRDRKARELANDNMMLRKKIHTVVSRLATRLFAETDQKNVPEETKPLVRMVLGMLEKNDTIYRHIMLYNKKQMVDIHDRLEKMNALYGVFDFNEDLNWLILNPGQDQDTAAKEAVEKALLDIETGMLEYRTAEGHGVVTLQDRRNALEKVQQAVSTIWNVINARNEVLINGRKMQVIDLAMQMASEMQDREYKGERTGKRGMFNEQVAGKVGYGNLTPEYFFKNLKNKAMSLLKQGLNGAENRGGLEAYKAKQRVAQIVKETGYGTWDGQEKHEVAVSGKRTVTMTTEQIMALYATWKRESNALRPEETSHLLHGGFMLNINRAEMKNGRIKMDQRPIRMTKDNLNSLASYLTEEQKAWVDQIVDYMSGELAELGNEASMQMYGIKKFTEQYYFPIKSWSGVLNKRSDAGVQNNNENRAAQQSFSKRVRNNANNTIVIGDFTATAMKHIAGMINYNTVAPAIENMNKVLNQQLQYGQQTDEYDDSYKMNMRALFAEKYGMLASDYLARFMQDMNGGIARQAEKSLKETLLTTFRKGAVAGSLSVAAQQPLSYIRAAMMINPKYLAQAILPTHWGRIHEEMVKYSGLAVIKDMGRFDMNQGRSMIDFITPEESMSKARRFAQKAMDATTVLPEKMDQITWGRLWIACKLETQAENPEMDPKSEEFMQEVAEKFNDLVRRTQVYDSIMVKSQNMRSTNYAIKSMTSFMAEPTLTLNVLADAVRNFNSKGGKLNMAKAGATFVLSAAAQALVKALMSTGRSPDKKKTWEEQFLTKWFSLFLGEANPITLVPGFNDMIELLKYGEISDDAMGVIGKLKNMILTTINWAGGKNKDHYKNFEETVGQMAQIFTNVPLKNLMRDARAIYNFFTQPYAKRDTSGTVLKYGMLDAAANMDNITGTLNFYLTKAGAGYGTGNGNYYDRIYDAMQSGDKQRESELREYMTLGKGVTEKGMKQELSNRINAAGKKGEMSGTEIVQQKLDNGASAASIKSWITTEYKAQYIAADTEGRRKLMNELTKMYKLIGVSGEDAMKIVQKWVKDEKKKE